MSSPAWLCALDVGDDLHCVVSLRWITHADVIRSFRGDTAQNFSWSELRLGANPYDDIDNQFRLRLHNRVPPAVRDHSAQPWRFDRLGGILPGPPTRRAGQIESREPQRIHGVDPIGAGPAGAPVTSSASPETEPARSRTRMRQPRPPIGRPNPAPGSKHHLITDGQDTPLAVILTGGNRDDVTQPTPLLDAR
jgi:hypothetical protein